MKKYLLSILIAMIVTSAFAQNRGGDYDKTLRARDTLIADSFFKYKGDVVPVEDLTYHQFSADSLVWRKDFQEGDCYVRFSNELKTNWWVFNFCADTAGVIEETDPTVASYIKSITEEDIAKWDTAYIDRVDSVAVRGTYNKTLDLYINDEDTIQAAFSDLIGDTLMPPQVLSYSAYITQSYESGNDAVVTLADDITSYTLEDVPDGGSGQIVVIQDNTGGHGVLEFIHSGLSVLYEELDTTGYAAKQDKLNGIGFVKANGNVITYDNNTYQQLLTNPVTGTGLNTYVPLWNSTSELSLSSVYQSSNILTYNAAYTINQARQIPDYETMTNYVNSAISGGTTYLGTWDASTNTPELSDATGDQGDIYAINVTGTQNLGSGSVVWSAGGFAIHNGTKWEYVGSTNAVTSVNSYTGAVALYPELTGNLLNIRGNSTTINLANATNVSAAYNGRISSLTTTGSSGAATFTSNVLNIPNYTLTGLGFSDANYAKLNTFNTYTANSRTTGINATTTLNSTSGVSSIRYEYNNTFNGGTIANVDGRNDLYAGGTSYVFMQNDFRLQNKVVADNVLNGVLYYDTDDNTFRGYNGTSWLDLGATGGDMFLATEQTVTGTKTFNTIKLNGSLSGVTTLSAASTAGTTTQTLQGITGTIYSTGGVDVSVPDGGTGRSSHTAYGLITGGTTSTAAQQSIVNGVSGTVLTSNGVSAFPSWATVTGTGSVVKQTSPTLTTPNIGVATATSVTASGAISADIITVGDNIRNQTVLSDPVFTLGQKSVTTYKKIFIVPAQGATFDDLYLYGTMGGYADTDGKGKFELQINNRNTAGLVSKASYIGSLIKNQDIVIYRETSGALAVYGKTVDYTLPWVINAMGTFEIGTVVGTEYPVYVNRSTTEQTTTPTGTLVFSLKEYIQTVPVLTVAAGVTTLDANRGLNGDIVSMPSNTVLTLSNIAPNMTGNIRVTSASAYTLTFAASGYTIMISPALLPTGDVVTVTGSNNTDVFSYWVVGTTIVINGTKGYL